MNNDILLLLGVLILPMSAIHEVLDVWILGSQLCFIWLSADVLTSTASILHLGNIQSAKILLLPPKYEIIMVPSNHSNFQYCDSNIGLFSIAPCKVIILNPLCILFVSVLCFFFASNYRDRYTYWSILFDTMKFKLIV